MKKILTAYFSTGGTTAVIAKALSQEINSDLYEITPKQPYTAADLDWNNRKSRSSIEMQDKDSRPEIEGRVANMDEYDILFVGFPIWWYVAPTIINTFLEMYDLSGKIVIPFATSGGSGMGDTNKYLQPSCTGAELMEGKRFGLGTRSIDIRNWIKQMGIEF